MPVDTPVARSDPREAPGLRDAGPSRRGARRGGRCSLDAVLRGVVLAAALVFVALFVVVALGRLRYPFELEWMEGGVLDSVRRVAGGRSLYARPSLQFTAYLYTPLYYYVGAGVGALFGTTVVTLRLVSFVSGLVAAVLVGGLVQRETRDLWAAVVATGLFLACYRISGAWLDLARVDALFLALTLGGVLLARTRRAATVVLAGALTGAAVQTKQQALIIGLAVAVALWREERARAVRYVVGLVGTVAVVSAALEVASGGWFHVYAVELLVRHEIVDAEVLDFWTHDLWQPLAIAVVLTVALFLLPGRLERATRRFYALVTIGCVVAAYSSRLHSGGYDNVLLPAYAAVAVTFGLALHHLGHAGPRVSRALARVVLVAAVVQFGVLLYNPAAQIPTATAVARGDALLAELRRLPGPIAVFGHGWYAERVGHAQVAQCAAVDDVLRAHLDGVSDRLAATRARALRGHRYRAVIVDSQRSLACVPADLARYYRPAYRLRSPWPLTGTPTRPFTVWVPRP